MSPCVVSKLCCSIHIYNRDWRKSSHSYRKVRVDANQYMKMGKKYNIEM